MSTGYELGSGNRMTIGHFPANDCDQSVSEKRYVMKSIREAQGVGNFYRKALRHVNEFKPLSHDKETINTSKCLTDLAQSCDAKGISNDWQHAGGASRKTGARPPARTVATRPHRFRNAPTRHDQARPSKLI